jgi:CO dehydrogenase/acetyl-CoA synthase beta subunit
MTEPANGLGIVSKPMKTRKGMPSPRSLDEDVEVFHGSVMCQSLHLPLFVVTQIETAYVVL